MEVSEGYEAREVGTGEGNWTSNKEELLIVTDFDCTCSTNDEYGKEVDIVEKVSGNSVDLYPIVKVAY